MKIKLKRILTFYMAFVFCAQTLAPGSLTAGGRNTLINRGEQTLEGAKFVGGNGGVLKGSKTKIRAIGLRNLDSHFEYDEGIAFNDTDAYGHDVTTQTHADISGGDAPVAIESDEIEADYTARKSINHPWLGKKITIGEVEKPSWVREIETQSGIKWNPVEEQGKSWDESRSVLNAEFTVLVGIGATLATMGAGSFGVFAAAPAAGSTAATVTMASTITTAVGQAAAVGLASSGAISTINNQFNMGAVLTDITSPDSMKSLAISMVTAGATAGMSQFWDVGQMKAGMDMVQRGKIVAQQGVVSAGVRGAMSGVTGEKITSIARSEVLSGGLALGQAKIGDIGIEKGLETGSIGKVAMHSIAGGIYSASSGASALSGAIGGASSELVAGMMEQNHMSSGSGQQSPPSLTADAKPHPNTSTTTTKPTTQADAQAKLNSRIGATTKLTAAATSLLSGGTAKDITTAGTVGQSAIEYNFIPHLAVAAVEAVSSIAAALTVEEAAVLAVGTGVAAYSAANSTVHDDNIDNTLSTPLPELTKPDTIYTPVVERQVSVLSTPAVELKPIILVTPEHEVKSWQRLPGYETHTGPNASVLFSKNLLPNEGKVGTYGELQRTSDPYDDLAIHHMPNKEYMKQFGITTNEGVSIMVQQPHRGSGLHTEIHKKLRIQDPNLKPREALVESVLRLRKVYKDNDRYATQINEGLLEVIKQSKERQPNLFNKVKKDK